MVSKQKKKNRREITLIVLVALATIGLTSLIYFSLWDVNVIYYDFIVSDYVGINLDKDKMHFGAGAPGHVLERTLIMQADKKSLVRIKSPVHYVYPDLYEFVIEKGEVRNVKLKVSIPRDIEEGLYEGKITIFQRDLE